MECIANNLDEKVPIIKDNVIINMVGDESIVNPPFEDEIEPYIITLNSTGAFVLNKIDGKNTIKDIINDFKKVYNVNEKKAKEDLYKLIEDLEEGSIIRWKK